MQSTSGCRLIYVPYYICHKELDSAPPPIPSLNSQLYPSVHNQTRLFTHVPSTRMLCIYFVFHIFLQFSAFAVFLALLTDSISGTSLHLVVSAPWKKSKPHDVGCPLGLSFFRPRRPIERTLCMKRKGDRKPLTKED